MRSDYMDRVTWLVTAGFLGPWALMQHNYGNLIFFSLVEKKFLWIYFSPYAGFCYDLLQNDVQNVKLVEYFLNYCQKTVKV